MVYKPGSVPFSRWLLFLLHFCCQKCHATYPSSTQKLATLLLFGLASSGVCPAIFVTKNAVCSYHTISPLPASWRYIFCGTFPKVTLAGCYPALCFCEARTFLSIPRAIAQPSDIFNVPDSRMDHKLKKKFLFFPDDRLFSLK